MVLISVEGNIGAGKSTLMQLLKTRGFLVKPEPVVDWTIASKDGTTINVLEEYYNNPKKYCFCLQTGCLRSRVDQTRFIDNGFVERSVYSDKRVFADLQLKLGNMDLIEYGCYLKQWEQAIRDTKKRAINGHIYLRTDWQTCFERKNQRQRAGESVITESYLQNVEELHEQWLNTDNTAPPDVPVLILNGNEDLRDEEVQNKTIRKIKEFICYCLRDMKKEHQ